MLVHCAIYNFCLPQISINQYGKWKIMLNEILLTGGKCFKKPNANNAIAIDVAVENCIFKKVTEHFRLKRTGTRTPIAMQA